MISEPGYDKQRQKTGQRVRQWAGSRTEGSKLVASKDKEVNKAARDSNDALVCCIENTVEDRIMVSGASFHARYCTKELERLEQYHCLRKDYSQFNYVSSGYLVSKVS
ncbi:hypothetical protein Tco_1320039 [Tanacetum coccineum]